MNILDSARDLGIEVLGHEEAVKRVEAQPHLSSLASSQTAHGFALARIEASGIAKQGAGTRVDRSAPVRAVRMVPERLDRTQKSQRVEDALEVHMEPRDERQDVSNPVPERGGLGLTMAFRTRTLLRGLPGRSGRL